jgi:hypothetical protein
MNVAKLFKPRNFSNKSQKLSATQKKSKSTGQGSKAKSEVWRPSAAEVQNAFVIRVNVSI